MGGGPRHQGDSDQLPNFTTLFWRLNAQCRLKRRRLKRSATFLGKKCTIRVWEKCPSLTLVWGPRMVNPTLRIGVTKWNFSVQLFRVNSKGFKLPKSPLNAPPQNDQEARQWITFRIGRDRTSRRLHDNGKHYHDVDPHDAGMMRGNWQFSHDPVSVCGGGRGQHNDGVLTGTTAGQTVHAIHFVSLSIRVAL